VLFCKILSRSVCHAAVNMVHFKIPYAGVVAVVAAPVLEDEDAAYVFASRPMAKDVILYRENVLQFFCSVTVNGARSKWGQCVEPGILVRIATLAAPYIVSADIFMARFADDKFADDYLMCFEPHFRDTEWWWQKGDWVQTATDSDGTVGGGIVAGGICMVPHMDNDNMTSIVMLEDEEGDAETFVMVIERRGSTNCYMDLMVHKNKTMRDVLRFLTVHFRLHQDQSTVMLFCGMREDGTADLENTDGGLYLHSKHPAPMMDKSMGDMWTILQSLADDMVQLWRGAVDPAHGHWDTTVQEHDECWNIINNTVVLMD